MTDRYQGSGFFGLMLLTVALVLGVAGSAWAVGLDQSGGLSPRDFNHLTEACSQVTVVKASQSPGSPDRAYVIQAACALPDLPPFSVTARVAFDWLGQYGTVYESIEVAGGVTGHINTSLEKCDKDPFLTTSNYSCTGEKKLSTDLAAVLFWKERALFGQSVAPGQVSQALKAPASVEPGVVTIVNPTEYQAIVKGAGSFLVRFADNPTFKPDPNGAVRLEWQRMQQRGGWVALSGPATYVEHFKMAQVVSLNDFPTPGRYRVRAIGSPQNTWSPWREFSVFGRFDDASRGMRLVPIQRRAPAGRKPGTGT